ncbi:MAG: hypothetical protein RL346_357 [Verrucomicrobiota bacterium]|jgi:hypothetical protein
MKISPTIEGGLRIDPESDTDWLILRAIMVDANAHPSDLATRLGNMMSDKTVAKDWKDYIVPDLRESFADDLHHVYACIESAAAGPDGSGSAIWITPADASRWYSALNQARLTLEEIHHFGDDPELAHSNLNRSAKDALLRSRIYCTLQSLILDHVLGA